MLIHVSNGHNTDLLRTLFSKLIYLISCLICILKLETAKLFVTFLQPR